MGLLLYTFSPQDRSGKIRWILAELELSYELKTLDGKKGEHKSDEYKKIHPLSMVPALQDDETTIFESGAIAIYLSDKYSGSVKLAPPIDSQYRGDYLKWIFMATTTLDPLLIKVFSTKGLEDSERSRKINDIYLAVRPAFVMLEGLLKKSQYIVGNEFSSADIMLAQPLEWARKGGILEKHSIVETYLKNLKERAACKKSGIFG
jgi:glutathione S-transferase